jgi:hypothetical protein
MKVKIAPLSKLSSARKNSFKINLELESANQDQRHLKKF